ncbi:hypothetical protein BaRGS_00014584 [Batillaria attramentaria]|uniref:Uncharacterized protein n=1 Tax=Batillaria attramentaria TaxID=370345 RepID=A0ABD0L3L1_9CAEN
MYTCAAVDPASLKKHPTTKTTLRRRTFPSQALRQGNCGAAVSLTRPFQSSRETAASDGKWRRTHKKPIPIMFQTDTRFNDGAEQVTVKENGTHVP